MLWDALLFLSILRTARSGDELFCRLLLGELDAALILLMDADDAGHRFLGRVEKANSDLRNMAVCLELREAA